MKWVYVGDVNGERWVVFKCIWSSDRIVIDWNVYRNYFCWMCRGFICDLGYCDGKNIIRGIVKWYWCIFFFIFEVIVRNGDYLFIGFIVIGWINCCSINDVGKVK